MNDKKNIYDIQIVCKVNITSDDIDDIIACALEGGINYWCCCAEVTGKYLGDYASDQISRGGTLILHDAESSDKWELTLDKFLKGMKLAIEHGIGLSVNLADGSIDISEIDAEVADTIVQLGLFGEVMFG